MNSNLVEILQAVDRELAQDRNSNNFAVFDFDGTCIVNDIGEAVLAYMARHDLFRNTALVPDFKKSGTRTYSAAVFERYYDLLDRGDVRGAYELCAKTIAGFSFPEIRDVVLKTIEFEGEGDEEVELFGRTITKGIRSREEVVALMRALEVRKIVTWIVSATPAFVVKAATEFYGLRSKFIGVQNVLDQGVATLELERPMPIVEGKVDCIKTHIDSLHRPLLGAGDSMNDLPMLEYCDIKLVLKSGQKSLIDIVRERGWFLM